MCSRFDLRSNASPVKHSKRLNAFHIKYKNFEKYIKIHPIFEVIPHRQHLIDDLPLIWQIDLTDDNSIWTDEPMIRTLRWATPAQNLFSLKINDIYMKIASLKYFISVTRTSFEIRYLIHDAIFHSLF